MFDSVLGDKPVGWRRNRRICWRLFLARDDQHVDGEFLGHALPLPHAVWSRRHASPARRPSAQVSILSCPASAS